MKTMYIYEPAMCCETGVCGVSVDPELLRISTVANNLKKQGVFIQRFNLNNSPQEFIKNTEINQLINREGVEALPATIIDGVIAKTKAYPTNVEIATWLEIPMSYLEGEASKVDSAPQDKDGCGCDDGCGCKGGCC